MASNNDAVFSGAKGKQVGIKPGMTDPTSSNIARDGAPKRVQKDVPIKGGMTDQTKASQLTGRADTLDFNGAPDASGPELLDPSKGIKKFGPVKAAWGMTDANGDSINDEIGGQVLSEAALLGR
jgi:hypothetical protein